MDYIMDNNNHQRQLKNQISLCLKNIFEMEDMSRKYPEYDNLDEQELNNEYGSLTQKRLDLLRDDIESEHNEFVDVKERMNYIDRILENRQSETTFTDTNGKTVTIKRNGNPSTSVLAPELDITAKLLNEPKNEKIFAVEDFIRRNYDGNFKIDPLHNYKAIELIQNVDKTNNNITFKPLTSRNVRGKEQIVLKKDSNGVLQYMM